MAMPTRIPGVAGSKRREHQKTIPPSREVGETNRGVTQDPRLPSAEMGGNPGRKVLEVLKAVVEVGVGAVVGTGESPNAP